MLKSANKVVCRTAPASIAVKKQKKVHGIMKSGVDPMPHFLLDNATSKRISQQYELQESQYICRQIVTNMQRWHTKLDMTRHDIQFYKEILYLL